MESNNPKIGEHLSEILPPDIYAASLPSLEKALKGESLSFERKVRSASNKIKTLHFRVGPYLKDDTVDGLIVVGVDISRLKELEKMNTENQALLFQKSKLSLLGEMAGGIAHEINNPLAIIKGKVAVAEQSIKFLKGKPPGMDKIQGNLRDISETVDRIAKIIKGLRAFSRDSEQDPFTNVAMEEIVQGAVNLVSEKLKSKGVLVQIIGGRIDQIVNCNQVQLEQVILNLIANSADAIANLDYKWIRIEISKAMDDICIRVTDSGPGISPEIVDKMMNPFFTTKEVGAGTGLGLSISQGIIENHGGHIEYELYNGNTSFLITLPRARSGRRAAA